MVKKVGCFSCVKRAFVPHFKKKLANESGKKSTKEKKKGLGKLRHGESKSFLPIFRQPSSIEKIFSDYEREQQRTGYMPPTPSDQPTSVVPSEAVSPRAASRRAASPGAASRRAASPGAASPGAASPGAASPGAASPGAASPGAASPGAASPRAASPGAASLGAASQRAASLGAASPRAASPGAASQRAASLGAAFPRAASPRATFPKAASPRAASPVTERASPRVSPPRVASPEVSSPGIVNRTTPTPRNLHDSAIKIQAAYRGFMARRSLRSLKGLVRLQSVVRGRSVKRQTMNAMKHMHRLVRVQSQLQSQRLQLLESQAQCNAQYRNDKEIQSSSKWSQTSEAGNNEDWDDSLLPKEEREARLQRKVDAVMRKEKATAYAYSRQSWKPSPRTAQTTPMNSLAAGNPWWWNWLERQIPPSNPSEARSPILPGALSPQSEQKPILQPQSSNHGQHNLGIDNVDPLTPKSNKSSILSTPKSLCTPTSIRSKTHPTNHSNFSRHSRLRYDGSGSPFDVPLKDDESLTSCPPFSGPRYMSMTVSAKAKVRANSNPKERFPGTPTSVSSARRLSFPLTPRIGSSKWSRGSSPAKDSPARNKSVQSIDNVSVHSTVSMPVGRRPFNRYV